jgi:hypothetical protein
MHTKLSLEDNNMRYLYLVQLSNPTRSFAYRTPDKVTLDEYVNAENHGYKWVNEEEAISMNLEIPNNSGHWGIITTGRCLYLKAKIEDRAIWVLWLDKWRCMHEYRPVGKYPSKEVMEKVELKFRLNSGIPINFSLQIEFNTNY